MQWLVISIGLSIVLTVLINVGLRMFPKASRQVTSAMTKPKWTSVDPTPPSDRRVRMWAPWKAMILGSVILTIVANVVLWVVRG